MHSVELTINGSPHKAILDLLHVDGTPSFSFAHVLLPLDGSKEITEIACRAKRERFCQEWVFSNLSKLEIDCVDRLGDAGIFNISGSGDFEYKYHGLSIDVDELVEYTAKLFAVPKDRVCYYVLNEYQKPGWDFGVYMDNRGDEYFEDEYFMDYAEWHDHIASMLAKEGEFHSVLSLDIL